MDNNTFNQIITILAVLGALFVVFAVVMSHVSRVFKSCGDITDSLTHGPMLIIGIIFVLVAGGLIAQRYKITPQVSYKNENGSYGIRLNNSEETKEKRTNEKPAIKRKVSLIQPDSPKKEGKTQFDDFDGFLKSARKTIGEFFEQPSSEK